MEDDPGSAQPDVPKRRADDSPITQFSHASIPIQSSPISPTITEDSEGKNGTGTTDHSEHMDPESIVDASVSEKLASGDLGVGVAVDDEEMGSPAQSPQDVSDNGNDLVEAERAPDIESVVKETVEKETVEKALVEAGTANSLPPQSPQSIPLQHTPREELMKAEVSFIGEPTSAVNRVSVNEDEDKSSICGVSKMLFWILICLAVLVIAGGITAGILFFGDSDTEQSLERNEPAPSETRPTSAAPSESPTPISRLASLLMPGDVLDKTSYQFQAVKWLVEDDPRALPTLNVTTELLERYALAATFFATTGQSWTNNTGWLSENHHCKWSMIECNADQESTIQLEFGPNNLVGLIPSEIGQFSNLKRLYMYDNTLPSSIPTEFGLLESLEEMQIWKNALFGPLPSELGKLTKLSTLGVSDNSLTGIIPTELALLTRLSVLHLQNNLLKGSIPTHLSNLESLTELGLSSNKLEGSLPSELFSLTLMESLSFSENELSGTLPSSLGDLSMLTYLSVWDNNFRGTVPSELAQLTRIQKAFFDETDLTGGLENLFCGTLQLSDPKFEFWADCGGTPSGLSCSCCTSCCDNNGNCEYQSSGCKDIYGWYDFNGDDCSWYEENDSFGCPTVGGFGGGTGFAGTTASDACCHCGGQTCEDLAGWRDGEGDSCVWYELNDQPGCPNHGTYIGGTDFENISPNEACCYCQ